MTNEKSQKIAKKFVCETCYYKCFNKFDYNKHLSTRKHLKTNETIEKSQKVEYVCDNCNNTYKHQSSLCKHKRTCCAPVIISIPLAVENPIFETLQELVKSNIETQRQNEALQIQVLELCKNGTTRNSHNKTFNLNIFLNEQCKDAINFSDFINNIQISYEDLENNAQLGFVGGISKIFLDNLKQLDVTERPIHCTDIKRETMYIKDENTWTKQSHDEKLQKAIQTVSYRSMGKLAEWKQENPDYKDCNSKFSQKCLDIHRHTLAGSDRQVYYPKVIHVLARETASGLSNTLISTK